VVELDQWEVTDPQEAISHYISIEGLQAERARPDLNPFICIFKTEYGWLDQSG